tara:strand:- start:393 stop:650 length:258 start_codon:yes stop_codon:yes gene_type:complete
MTTYNKLTREQKLLAEIIVQLGNISEAINVLATKDVDLLQQQVSDLEGRLASLHALTSQAETTSTAVTPDTLNDVVSTLGIELPQ